MVSSNYNSLFHHFRDTDVEEHRDLENKVRGHSLSLSTNLCMVCTSLKSTDSGLSFCR